MALASATPRASGLRSGGYEYRTAPEASTQNDDAYVYTRLPRENTAPVDNGLTERVQR